MRASEKIDTLAAGLYAVHRDLRQPVKRTKGQVRGNPNYMYLNLPDLIEHLKEPLREHSLFFTQDEVRVDGGVGIVTTVWTATGQWLEFGPLVMPHAPNADAQAVGSAISYGRRYHLLGIFGLAAEDDDGHRASEKPTSKAADTEGPRDDAYGEGATTQRQGGGGDGAEHGSPSSPAVEAQEQYLRTLREGKGGASRAITKAREMFGPEKALALNQLTLDQLQQVALALQTEDQEA